MAEPRNDAPLYHVLLIGCDTYPAPYKSLSGCVNDIDVIADLLDDGPADGIGPGNIRITRLAAPRAAPDAATDLPTRGRIVQELQRLAGDEVRQQDRVLIYYSGHGAQVQWQGSSVRHESIVPVDLQPIYDVEMSGLLHGITRRTTDVTLVLDSCHSEGATRDALLRPPDGADRALAVDPQLADPAAVRALEPEPPDPGLQALGPGGRSVGMAGTAPEGQGLHPAYLMVAACQATETAGEGAVGQEPRHGVLTFALARVLEETPAAERHKLRWADVLVPVLAEVEDRCGALRRVPQRPWVVGRTERRVFGGPWEAQDPGFQVLRHGADAYTIKAGTLMGVTPGAHVAVYGATPRHFAAIDSAQDVADRAGLLEVLSATRTASEAKPAGPAFDVPPGARARVVRPGASERLRVRLDPRDAPQDAAVVEALQRSPLLQVEPADAADAEVNVTLEGGDAPRWRIWNTANEQEDLGLVARDAPDLLRRGLESYARYQTVLRMAGRCNDPALTHTLTVRLLDCTDAATVQATPAEDPDLPEAPRDTARAYDLPAGYQFCVQVANAFDRPVKASLLNCCAAGQVEYLGDTTLAPGDRKVIWRRGEVRRPFRAAPDFPERGSTDRLVVIATTALEEHLGSLTVAERVSTVVSAVRGAPGDRSALDDEDERSAGPPRLGTAVVQPIRVGPKTST